jgi:hypothetical protein
MTADFTILGDQLERVARRQIASAAARRRRVAIPGAVLLAAVSLTGTAFGAAFAAGAFDFPAPVKLITLSDGRRCVVNPLKPPIDARAVTVDGQQCFLLPVLPLRDKSRP